MTRACFCKSADSDFTVGVIFNSGTQLTSERFSIERGARYEDKAP